MKKHPNKPRQFAALLALASGAATLVSGCGGGASALPSIPTNPTPTTPTNSNLNRIAFSSNRDGNFEIYTMNPDGSDVQRVTTATGDDTKPAWSRDKTKLAFVSERDGNSEIYVQNIAGGKPVGTAQRLTNDAAFDGAPSWNPDGTQLVFESDRGAFVTSLYITNIGSRDVRRLTQRPEFNEANPSWSPKGDLIAFQSQQAPITGQSYPDGIPGYLFTIRPNGENLNQVTPNGRRDDQEPTWRSDEKNLVFSTPIRISIIDLNSNSETFLTQIGQGDFLDPNYSPDGTQIVCSGFAKGVSNINLYLLQTNKTNGNPIRIFEDSSKYKDPSW